MPDTRRRRGPHPKDRASFSTEALAPLRAAVADLSWLFGRGYPAKAALKLVGDRYSLRDRQRKALQRCAAGDETCRLRAQRSVPAARLAGETVAVDGYNVVLSLEAALSGGVLLLARDGVLRDLASLSGHYRKLEVTRSAVELLVEGLDRLRVAEVECLLDRPVSNSARLKGLIESVAVGARASWRVRLAAHTDRDLVGSGRLVASADSAVLDASGRWVNLARHLVETGVPEAWIVDLR